MTPLGKIATVSIAALTLSAQTSALAGGQPPAVEIVCGADLSPVFCEALALAIREIHGAWPVDIVASGLPDARFSLTFIPVRQSTHVMAGHVEWRDRAGRTGSGPELEFSVVDAPLSDAMLLDYARQLIRFSSLPL